MKPILLSALIATVSPLAIAQQAMGHPDAPKVSEAQQDVMAGDTVNAPVPSEIETAILSDWFETELDGDLHPSVIEAARRAYAQTMFKPIWTETGAEDLTTFSSDLFKYGLTSSDVLEANLQKLVNARFETGSKEARAEADLALSAAWLRMAAAMSGTMKHEGEAETSQLDAATFAALPQDLIDAGKGKVKAALEKYESKYPQYERLKDALMDYREIRDEGGWLAIPEGDIVEAGGSDPRIPAIRTRLSAEGYTSQRSTAAPGAEAVYVEIDMTDASAETGPKPRQINETDDESVENEIDPQIYDEGLVEAVKTFQSRHGIERDGIIGPATLAAMNESVDSKIARIAESMDRWRHQGAVDEKYIWVNIPSYTAEGWEDGKREITMKTIVGKEDRETPTFNDEIEYVVANPNWYAPVSIVRRDKLPKLQNDPGYAERGNYKVYDRSTGEQVSAYSVNWNDPASAEKYRLVQQSGAGNALGELKIIFPNQYSVYLHDTPSVSLFDHAKRAFSSGCVRLEKPVQMATWLAEDDRKVQSEELKDAVDSDTNQRIELSSRIPVHITYMTVTANNDGSVSFWRDIYDRTEGIRRVEKYAPLNTVSEADSPADLEKG
ncbi:L,D-transpeptidase family protein [Henriciella sp.]|uniref:L,D-transpeptidase family protein n=1 Tax=Henriciella sp. TaxID=1968823 RepID=UPI003C724FC5